jgi:hypothetical protein
VRKGVVQEETRFADAREIGFRLQAYHPRKHTTR